jgi:hypothetical protein
MKKKLCNPLVIIGCFLFVITLIGDLSGKWTGVIYTPDGNSLEVAYNFKVDGSKLTGTAVSPAGEVNIDNGKIDSDKFSFTVNVNGTDYPHTGKMYADSCGLDIDFGGVKVHTKLLRSSK